MSFQTRLIAKHFFNKKYEGLAFFVDPGKQTVEISIILSVSPPTVVQQLSKQKKKVKRKRGKNM